jgi:hypothetical protein
MSPPVPAKSNMEDTRLAQMPDDTTGSLDVGWLLHSKKGE